MQSSRRSKLRSVLQASCCLKRSDCCLPPKPVYFLEDSRRFYELLSPVLLLLSLTVLQLSETCESVSSRHWNSKNRHRPARSPYLNPKEHAWDALVRQVAGL
ncbi:hypothetical protein LAZ67_8000941 [Cordylochernes scorpioides]|uniref:Uncharacterized protein n=1 Tax=Cordylochernes scorpioides TaxID=51811 RepID=A0ABY6KUV3_9ARAC|nr:hypothetical protein LAZ67_8000941 [Cordylochernes scorpioides]